LRATRFLLRNRARTKAFSRGRYSSVVASSYIIAVFVHRRSLSAYHPHRISRRPRRLGGFLPRIEGPVLEAVGRKEAMRNFQNVMHRFFASASRAFLETQKSRDVLFQDGVERGGQQCA
jgi:hypothetical protein